MFIGGVGSIWRESVYFIEDLYRETPYNLGHNIFEGTKRMHDGRLETSSTCPPIFEYGHHLESRPISAWLHKEVPDPHTPTPVSPPNPLPLNAYSASVSLCPVIVATSTGFKSF